ncbi:alpha-tubulin N-acetyltransferase-like isoform X2 [Anthonomus grandis grandis]|uniref:alpha-tubulin N-acetyltransferase-like isoform X2 n=1 Tax=Anthonomus grandis grandis TaxID=2921223 RepID=UPI002165479D|nr:alpha-tubulin N-acetyltransferase-like isoform X2 [Anthonomus grandis grandis]
MDFRFNLNEIFREPVVEIGNTLVPPKFTGDKRALWDTQSKVSQIVNAMGEASAAAQGLSKPITTADRLRNSEHKLYLLIDHSANNGRGSVTGMLKTGQKGLYVFDREGQHYQVSPPCILDFYVHESKQRSGYGRRLFEHMLFREQVEPVKMAIDRPSEKLLGFLNKHYGLHSPVKQMNNYVVFDGFFPRAGDHPRTPVDTDQSSPTKKQSANGLQHGGFPTSPYGRYGARKPPCSMNQIIHNDSAVIKRNQEPTGQSAPKADRPNSLNIEHPENGEPEANGHAVEVPPPSDDQPEEEEELTKLEQQVEKIEIEQEKVDTPLSGRVQGSPEAAGLSTRGANTPEQAPGLTDQGYFDLKFYHNKLW